MSRVLWLLPAVACVAPATVQSDLQRTATTIATAHRVYATLCAPEALANAQANLDFARVDLRQGDVQRANEHLELAHAFAVAAVEESTPCGGVDRDRDTIPDIVDACPDTPEDMDGHADGDGCRDVDPYGDDDGDGIDNRDDACLDTPEDIDGDRDDDGCPESPADRDEDGLSDAQDQCPDEPGPVDAGGCPTRDLDGDGILDADDLCPEEPEITNDYLDEDGCPDSAPSRVRVTKTRVQIDETVQFERGSANLLQTSHGILNEVAKVLEDAPYLRLRVEGHTDSQGSDVTNMELSQARAASVVRYLVAQGVEADRLTSLGFGEAQPIDTNRTESGRARNRRVEFHIRQDGMAPR